MKYNYKILKIELENLDDECGGSNLCVRATVKTESGTEEILEWLNINFEENGYNIEEIDKNDNDVVEQECFPFLYCDDSCVRQGQDIAFSDMWNEIGAWVSKQDLLAA